MQQPMAKENSNIKNFYIKIQSLLGRVSDSYDNNDIKEDMLSPRASTVASDDSFITPISSAGDLMAMSPERGNDVTEDLLTGTEFDSICDVTMQEVPTYKEFAFDKNSIDYLVKCGDSKVNHNQIDSGKESLFVKFDPLYASRKQIQSEANCTEAVCDNDVGYETGSSASVATENVATSKQKLSSGQILLTSKDKPMQVVPPVLNCDTPKTVTLTKSAPVLMRSMSAIMTPTHVATDRLITISGSTPPVAAPRSPQYYNHSLQQLDRVQSVRHILQKRDQEVLQLMEENRHLKSSLQDIEHTQNRQVEELECKIKKLTGERDSLVEKELKLIHQMNEKILSNKQMCIVMEEYEKTISLLIEEQQSEKIENQELQKKLTLERDQALNHLANMEISFNDLLAKYEKCKSVIVETKEREIIFEQNIAHHQDGIKKYETLYNNIKKITSESLKEANETLENLKRKHYAEITKLNAINKKHEVTISSLQESLAQKTRDNENLTRICDQLINEVK